MKRLPKKAPKLKKIPIKVQYGMQGMSIPERTHSSKHQPSRGSMSQKKESTHHQYLDKQEKLGGKS